LRRRAADCRPSSTSPSCYATLRAIKQAARLPIAVERSGPLGPRLRISRAAPECASPGSAVPYTAAPAPRCSMDLRRRSPSDRRARHDPPSDCADCGDPRGRGMPSGAGELREVSLRAVGLPRTSRSPPAGRIAFSVGSTPSSSDPRIRRLAAVVWTKVLTARALSPTRCALSTRPRRSSFDRRPICRSIGPRPWPPIYSMCLLAAGTGARPVLASRAVLSSRSNLNGLPDGARGPTATILLESLEFPGQGSRLLMLATGQRSPGAGGRRRRPFARFEVAELGRGGATEHVVTVGRRPETSDIN